MPSLPVRLRTHAPKVTAPLHVLFCPTHGTDLAMPDDLDLLCRYPRKLFLHVPLTTTDPSTMLIYSSPVR